jgi:hypothetical protein
MTLDVGRHEWENGEGPEAMGSAALTHPTLATLTSDAEWSDFERDGELPRLRA